MRGSNIQGPILVLGKNGMVGASLMRNSPANLTIFAPSRQELDLTNKKLVYRYLLDNHISSLILAAAKVGGIGANSKFQRDFFMQNLEIQNSVITAAADSGVQNLIFLGSSCIYPRLADQPISESSLMTGLLEPTNEGYALAKIVGIRLCKAISDEKGLNYFSLMPTNLYGPNDNFDPFASHVPAALLRKFHEAKINDAAEVIVWGTGEPLREFMHVDDMAAACWYMLGKEAGGELFNVGTGHGISIADFARMIAQVVGYGGSIIFDSTKPNGMPRKLLNVTKIQELGWKHQISLITGLEKTYDWYVEALKEGVVRGH